MSAGNEQPVSAKISGAIYNGVPIIPFKKCVELFKFFAKPKSPNFIVESYKNTFDGFISLWMILWS